MWPHNFQQMKTDHMTSVYRSRHHKSLEREMFTIIGQEDVMIILSILTSKEPFLFGGEIEKNIFYAFLLMFSVC